MRDSSMRSRARTQVFTQSPWSAHGVRRAATTTGALSVNAVCTLRTLWEPFCRSRVESRGLEARHDEVDDEERDEVREPRAREYEDVASRCLEDVPDSPRAEHPPDRPAPPADPGDRAHRASREHVGNGRVHVRGPALM